MEDREIERYLYASMAHSITVDVQELPDAPGNLRTVTIHQDHHVTIEYQTCRQYAHPDWENHLDWEGGLLKYIGQYDSLEDVIRDLENFLGKPWREWTNFTTMPYEPRILDDPDPTANLRYFEGLVRERNVKLPAYGRFRFADIYWRHIELFGEYRPDRLDEETDGTRER
jgi:hypothetical protein